MKIQCEKFHTFEQTRICKGLAIAPSLGIAISLFGAANAAWGQSSDSPALAPLAPARTLLDTRAAEDLLRGNGTSLGYALSHGGVAPGSLIVTLDGAPLVEGTGYTLDAAAGNITLTHSARPDQTVLVRYRYKSLSLGSGGSASSLPMSISILPTIVTHGLGLGMVRSDDGTTVTPLLSLRTGGLVYMTGSAGAFGSTSRSLLGDSSKTVKKSGSGHLISQSRTIGGKGASFSLHFQDVSTNFNNFASLRDDRSATDPEIAQLAKERGIKRLGFSGAIGTKSNAALQFSENSLNAGSSGGIRQEKLSLAIGGLSLSGNYLDIGEKFDRYKDLAESDLPTGTTRDAVQKLRGIQKLDFGGKWQMGHTLAIEGNLLNQSVRKAGQKTALKDRENNSHLSLAFAPGKGNTFKALTETARKIVDGKTKQQQHNQFDGETVVRFGRSHSDKDSAPGLILHGLQDRLALRETDGTNAVETDTIATLFGVRTSGTGAVRFNIEQRGGTEHHTNTPDKHNTGRLSDFGLQLNRTSLLSYMTSNYTTNYSTAGGNEMKENEKEGFGLTFGRGWEFHRSMDKNVTDTQTGTTKTVSEERTDITEFATDKNARIWASGEQRSVQNAQEPLEVRQKWDSGITFGGLSLRADGLGIHRSRIDALLHHEKNINLGGALALSGGWKATYTSFDRTDKDPNTHLDRNEALHEIAITSGNAPIKIALKQRLYDNRLDNHPERRQDIVEITPLHSLHFGLLQKGSVTLAYGTDSVKGEPGTGVSRKIIYDGNLITNHLSFEYGTGRDSSGGYTQVKGLRFSTDERKRLQIGMTQRLHELLNDHVHSTVWSRAWNIAFQLNKRQSLLYTVALSPEKPDQTIEHRRAEAFGYNTVFGNGGKFGVEYKRASDITTQSGSRSASFSLVSPTSPFTSYEFSYSTERTTTAGKEGKNGTYVVAYQYQPSNTLSIAFATRWLSHSGAFAPTIDIHDQSTASIEIKSAW